MTVYRRPGSPFFWYEFEVGTERIRESSKTTNKAAAKAIEADHRRRLKEQAQTGFVEMTLREACVAYYKAEILPFNVANSMRTFQTAANRMCAHFGDTTPVHTITQGQIHRWRDGMLAGGRVSKAKAESKALKVSTVNENVKALKKVLSKCHKSDALPKMPAIELAGTRKGMDIHRKKSAPFHYSPAQESAILAECKSKPWLFELAVFLFGTGARISEALQLRWKHVAGLNSDNRLAVVKITHDPDADDATTTKGQKTRAVPIPHRLRLHLLAMKARQEAAGYEGDSVFVWKRRNTTWLPLTYESVDDHFRQARVAAGVARGTIHTTRHTYASRLVENGKDLIIVRDLLGHSSVKQTEIYASLAPTSSVLENAVAGTFA